MNIKIVEHLDLNKFPRVISKDGIEGYFLHLVDNKDAAYCFVEIKQEVGDNAVKLYRIQTFEVLTWKDIFA